MKKSKQAGKYILSDFISASVAWLLFNILRYEVFAIDEGADSLLDYLQYPGVLGGQVVIPLFWLVLYYFSGYYNKPFGKSRLTELFSTFITVLIGTVFVFFALLLDDIPRSIDIYYKLFFGMFGLQFFITYIPRLLITQSGMRKIKNREWAMKVLIIGAGPTGICTLLCVMLKQPKRIIICEKDAARAEFVRKHYPDVLLCEPEECEAFVKEHSDHGGADVVLEVAGGRDTFQLAWKCARPNAIVTVVALYYEAQSLPLPDMYGKNLIFKTGGVDGCDCAEILHLIEEGKIDTTPLITHRFKLADIEEAYRIFENRLDGVIKIAITE